MPTLDVLCDVEVKDHFRMRPGTWLSETHPVSISRTQHITKAAQSKLDNLSEGESLIFTSGPGQTTTATRLPNGELDYRLNPTPERPGLNLFA
jgi:hypothetical protein